MNTVQPLTHDSVTSSLFEQGGRVPVPERGRLSTEPREGRRGSSHTTKRRTGESCGVELLIYFGNLATHMGPMALRRRLAAVLPLSRMKRRSGLFLDGKSPRYSRLHLRRSARPNRRARFQASQLSAQVFSLFSIFPCQTAALAPLWPCLSAWSLSRIPQGNQRGGADSGVINSPAWNRRRTSRCLCSQAKTTASASS
jgi:hypothetical protein